MSMTKAMGMEAFNEALHEITINRRDLLPNDVELEILYCGICHSDLHQVRNDWGHTNLPLVPGHEIVGRVTKVGKDVTTFKVGDLAGIGCIVDSCRTCPACRSGLEQFCSSGVTFSFNSPDRVSGGFTFGGFSKRYVCDARYVLHVPAFENLSATAPLLCAGITVYSPLKRYEVAGKKIAIVGIGGLGHVAIRFAKAMGAHVTVITTSEAKVADAKRLGADAAILSTDPAAMAAHRGEFAFILDTVSAKHNIDALMALLSVRGSLVMVGLSPDPLEVGSFSVVGGEKSLSGSNIGGIPLTQEMLDFAYEHNVLPDVEVIPVDYVNTAMERLAKGDVKYRFVVDMSTL